MKDSHKLLLPWKLDDNWVGARFMIKDRHGEEAAKTKYLEYAMYIVEAANRYEELSKRFMEYGWHKQDCNHIAIKKPKCTCGFDGLADKYFTREQAHGS